MAKRQRKARANPLGDPALLFEAQNNSEGATVSFFPIELDNLPRDLRDLAEKAHGLRIYRRQIIGRREISDARGFVAQLRESIKDYDAANYGMCRSLKTQLSALAALTEEQEPRYA